MDDADDENELLEPLFDVDSVEMKKSKACMLCSRDFTMFGGTKA